MPVGFWVFPWDIEDEGIDRFAARLEQLGVTSASPSVLYHSGPCAPAAGTRAQGPSPGRARGELPVREP